jgi:hypothetical protein
MPVTGATIPGSTRVHESRVLGGESDSRVTYAMVD